MRIERKLIFLNYLMMRKVFTDFEQIKLVKNIIIIPIMVAIVIIGIISAIGFEDIGIMEVEDTMDKELRPTQENSPEIQERLDEIERINLENEYKPKDREWITSGPFQIDRTEYILGEKIFLRIGGLEFDELGQVVFLMPSNGTHHTVYISIPFDGGDKSAFNYYLEPDLSKAEGICSVDDLVGIWKVVFRGTDYPNLEFRITEEILPGDEQYYEPVC